VETIQTNRPAFPPQRVGEAIDIRHNLAGDGNLGDRSGRNEPRLHVHGQQRCLARFDRRERLHRAPPAQGNVNGLLRDLYPMHSRLAPLAQP